MVKERVPIAYHEWRPEQTRISVGLQQLAFATFANAIEDAMGRTTSVYRKRVNKARRKNAAAALWWLRSAGRGDLSPFTPDWCAHLLGVDARWLARHGVARVAGGGLANWREWRAHRGENRIQRTPRLTKTCPECHTQFTTKENKRIYCGVDCARMARYGNARATDSTDSASVSGARQVAEARSDAEQSDTRKVEICSERYKNYVRFCLHFWKCTPASEVFWNILSG
jgi:hypothetical protein